MTTEQKSLDKLFGKVLAHRFNGVEKNVHIRMPVILAPGAHVRWLSEEPDPHDLMRSSVSAKLVCLHGELSLPLVKD